MDVWSYVLAMSSAGMMRVFLKELQPTGLVLYPRISSELEGGAKCFCFLWKDSEDSCESSLFLSVISKIWSLIKGEWISEYCDLTQTNYKTEYYF